MPKSICVCDLVKNDTGLTVADCQACVGIGHSGDKAASLRGGRLQPPPTGRDGC